MDEYLALTAWREAIAATDAAGAVPITEEGYEAFAGATFRERMAGRRYLTVAGKRLDKRPDPIEQSYGHLPWKPFGAHKYAQMYHDALTYAGWDSAVWAEAGPEFRDGTAMAMQDVLDAIAAAYLATRDASVARQVTSHQARLETALDALDTVVTDTTIRDQAWYWHADQANRYCGLALTAMREVDG